MHIELRDFTIHVDGGFPLTVGGRVILAEDGTVEVPAQAGSGFADQIVAAFTEWAERSRREDYRTHRNLFSELTGLHVCHTPRSLTTMRETIVKQRDKINGLKQQMREMKRGYERKIARLERGVRPVASLPIGTYSYTVTAESSPTTPSVPEDDASYRKRLVAAVRPPLIPSQELLLGAGAVLDEIGRQMGIPRI
jgi:hypothetical protein